jgi:1-acyl-sn-glycerol-3-phosphate acyltransferase
VTAVRSALFLLGAFVITSFFGFLIPVSWILNRRWPFHVARGFAGTTLKWAEWTCGIRCEVEGWEHVPSAPAILMAKHQSAWETLWIAHRFPDACWIVKRELLWLPFVGWGLLAMRAIAIDRSSGQAAREQIVQQGAERLKEGLWVTIFPEGTRVAPGKRGRYGIGGALLATRTGAPIVPIAHNAGEVWPRYAFRKHAGTVRVVIGPVIDPEGMDVLQAKNAVEDWIEGEMARITGVHSAHP